VKASRASLAALAVFVVLAGGLFPGDQHFNPIGASFAFAQNLGQRTVSGSVIDSSSAPVGGATVFLKNTKTKSIRSYTSANDGRFRFAQVGMTDDYDLWAEKNGRKSQTKTVSTWDARKDFETELKLK
jgi:hypothetical protein